MSYTALYRKFRPSEFSDVKGQDHIVTTLKNQIRADRIGHAYLFCGTRGTGKTTIAKIFAKAVNCEHPADGSPCGECPSCRAISSGTSMNVIEIDAASNNGVDNIREIRDEVAYSPTEGRYKVYIIDEVHMLSIGAFNALLKTLEEPPSYVIFILATTEANKIPITILSRCQRYDFRRITVETIAGRLRELMTKEQVEVEERALEYVAKAADGSMRDALSLLDQCIAFYMGQRLTYNHVLDVLGAVDMDVFSGFFRKVCARDLKGVIQELDQIILQGRELSQFVTDFIWYLRNLLMLENGREMEAVIDASDENLERMREEARLVKSQELMRYIRIFSELSGQIRYASQKRVMVEMALVKLCRPAMEPNYDSILQRLSDLERQIEQGIPAAVPVDGDRQEEREVSPAEERKISVELLPADTRMFLERFQEIRRKTGSWARQVLKNAGYRELPDHSGVQIILCRDYAVDEQALAEEIQKTAAQEFQMEIRVQVLTPRADTDSKEPWIDMGELRDSIDMDIEIEG